jgi:putative redox protein
LEISLQHKGGACFVGAARAHHILLDQPRDDGATDQGLTPAELLLASLGGCVGQYVAQYLRLRKLSARGLTIRVAAEPDPRPLRLRDFTVTILAPGLTEPQLRALERTFPAGLVQNAIRFENTVRVTAAPMHLSDKVFGESSSAD